MLVFPYFAYKRTFELQTPTIDNYSDVSLKFRLSSGVDHHASINAALTRLNIGETDCSC